MPTPKQYADALSATPRNSWKYLADAMQPVSEFADEFKVKQDVPLIGGMSAADFTGLKGAFGLADDASYGKYPIRGASLQTAKVDPRVIDAMGLAGALMPVAKNVGKAALGEAARQIHTGTGIGRAALNPRMNMAAEGISKFPQPDGEIRSAIAQRNAALPISKGGLGLPANNMPMDRAKAMGWDTPAYHATDADIKAFDPLKHGLASGHASANIPGTWVSGKPQVANIFAAKDVRDDYPIARYGNKGGGLKSIVPYNYKENANIMPLIIRSGENMQTMKAGEGQRLIFGGKGDDWRDTGEDFVKRYKELASPDVLKIKGHPLSELEFRANQYLLKNPSDIRSRFAAFDPFRRHEADILAGVGIGGMLDPEAVSEEFRKKERK